MTDEERAFRIAVATEHHAASGVNGDAERLRVFCNDTRFIPAGIYRDACELARQLADHTFVPTASEVIRAAVSLSPKEHDPAYQGNPADQRPEWWVAMIRAKRQAGRRALTSGGAERPREIAGRSRAGAPLEAGDALGALLAEVTSEDD